MLSFEVRRCASQAAAVLYAFEGEKPTELETPPNIAVVSLAVESWNRELSPWKAPKCFAGGEDFGGEAAHTLQELTAVVVPEAERRLGVQPAHRLLMGYSLAGLFSLYAIYHTQLFDGVGAVSASLWFDGWPEFQRTHAPVRTDARVYLSLGDREEHTKNARLRSVGEAMRESERLLVSQGLSATLEWNEGGHFQEVEQRMNRAAKWLAKPDGSW